MIGHNAPSMGPSTTAGLGEAALMLRPEHTVFARAELMSKSGHDLALPEAMEIPTSNGGGCAKDGDPPAGRVLTDALLRKQGVLASIVRAYRRAKIGPTGPPANFLTELFILARPRSYAKGETRPYALRVKS